MHKQIFFSKIKKSILILEIYQDAPFNENQEIVFIRVSFNDVFQVYEEHNLHGYTCPVVQIN
jgi:hypothetical protein